MRKKVRTERYGFNAVDVEQHRVRSRNQTLRFLRGVMLTCRNSVRLSMLLALHNPCSTFVLHIMWTAAVHIMIQFRGRSWCGALHEFWDFNLQKFQRRPAAIVRCICAEEDRLTGSQELNPSTERMSSKSSYLHTISCTSCNSVRPSYFLNRWERLHSWHSIKWMEDDMRFVVNNYNHLVRVEAGALRDFPLSKLVSFDNLQAWQVAEELIDSTTLGGYANVLFSWRGLLK